MLSYSTVICSIYLPNSFLINRTTPPESRAVTASVNLTPGTINTSWSGNSRDGKVLEKVSTNKNLNLQGTHVRLVHVDETNLLCCMLQNLHVLLLVPVYSYRHRYGPGRLPVLLVRLVYLLFSPRSLSVSAASFPLRSPLNYFSAALRAHHCLPEHREDRFARAFLRPVTWPSGP